MGSPISIPLDDLQDTLDMLEDIKNRIANTAGLSKVGSESDIGDSSLIGAVNSFDGAWHGGHERVQDNVKTFQEAAQGIIDNFKQTDDELGQALEQ
ncbi:hypothetical protein [Streptomyces sp. NPDC091371]|uniref:hypothetical protein n=1 Tax=Streptomyces sp. NPDC091371 TaxID=3155303 RepID=UPI00343F7865